MPSPNATGKADAAPSVTPTLDIHCIYCLSCDEASVGYGYLCVTPGGWLDWTCPKCKSAFRIEMRYEPIEG